jgi:putative RNA 2'-phosphotransferase
LNKLFSSKDQRYEVARYVASALRSPEARELLGADRYGSVGLEVLLGFLCRRYSFLTAGHLFEIAEKDAQRRFDLSEGRIRARTGHRFDVDLPMSPEQPPEILYHGTSEDASRRILAEGVRKIGKSHVHLSDTIERARRVGERKQKPPVIMKVRALEAHRKGIRFWRSGQRSTDGEIFLSDEIPADFVSVLPL